MKLAKRFLILVSASFLALMLPCVAWGVLSAEMAHPAAIRRAIEDRCADYVAAYPQSAGYLARLEELEREIGDVESLYGQAAQGSQEACDRVARLEDLRREVLLDNPGMDFTHILAVRRHVQVLGLSQNWQGNSSLPRGGYDNEIVLLRLDESGEPSYERVYRPERDVFVGDLCLHWKGDRFLFSSMAESGQWHVYESAIDGGSITRVTPETPADVDCYDACYLPDNRVILCSTACYTGVPCVYGGDHVANLYLLDRSTGALRQLCFEQDHNWSPRVLPSGRILYQRWEYSDTPHSNTRMLFHMNPDGTDQREYWGSGVYFPNSFFYARPLPPDGAKVIGVAGGHHGTPRSGRLLLVARTPERDEGAGVMREIPGWGREVKPQVRDRLVDGVWPQFLHPYPINAKCFLVSAKMSEHRPWGIYLVDIFDNMVLLAEEESYAFLEPIPVRQEPVPPLIPDRVNLASDEAVVYMQDVYQGGGLEGIPRGQVTSLRVFQYYFAHRGQGGLHGTLGNDCGWDIRQVLGTVPVQPDGSACFKAPANTPLAVQPLDAQGQALQVMRSWFTLQPGEQASCVGCHESQRTAPPVEAAKAFRRVPDNIQGGWHAPARGFSFMREVQPVLDKYCSGCHGDTPPEGMVVPYGREFPYLRGDKMVEDWSTQISGGVGPEKGGVFSESYAALQRFVRRPGIESDLHMLSPMDFHFSTTELGQLLRKGHYNVSLDKESRQRLVAWVDLNAPYHGTWGETHPCQIEYAPKVAERARELRMAYAQVGPAPFMEFIPELPAVDNAFIMPAPMVRQVSSITTMPEWPFDTIRAAQMQEDCVKELGITDGNLKISENLSIALALIPGGRFVMGSENTFPDESPLSEVAVRPFLMGVMEVTNEQYRAFDPDHKSRCESRNGYQFGRMGFDMDAPGQPAVRVSWEEAMNYCDWLSATTGLKVSLPTESQWEWAARAGSDQAFHFGAVDADYSKHANLADQKLREFVQCTARDNYEKAEIIENPSRHDDRIPRCDRFNDGAMISVETGRYLSNVWHLLDMHGNVSEWTRSAYMPYPYEEDDGRNDTSLTGVERIARGGSWRDRPHRATSSFRLPYVSHQRVFNVGFRVVVELEDGFKPDEARIVAAPPR